jgi:hypothetical protein
VSPVVHAFPSLQLVPFAIGAVPHAPDPVSQVATWQVGAAGQVFIVPATHAPLWQVSPTVHAFPSLQVVPFAIGAVPHAPEPVSQVATWHAAAGHVFIVPGAHDPFWQLSPTVQALPSLQLLPFVAGTQLAVVGAQTLQVPHADPEFCQAPF